MKKQFKKIDRADKQYQKQVVAKQKQKAKRGKNNEKKNVETVS